MSERVRPRGDREERPTNGRTELLALPSRRLEELRGALKFDKRQLDAVLEQQGKDYMDIADEVAFAIARRDKCKDDLNRAEAQAYIDNKNAAAADEEPKRKAPTVDELKSLVAVDPQVTAAQDRLRDAELELKRLQALEEAWKQRSYAIKEMVTLEVDAYGRVPDGHGRREYNEARAASRDSYRDKR